MFVLCFRPGYCHILEVILLALRDGKKATHVVMMRVAFFFV